MILAATPADAAGGVLRSPYGELFDGVCAQRAPSASPEENIVGGGTGENADSCTSYASILFKKD